MAQAKANFDKLKVVTEEATDAIEDTYEATRAGVVEYSGKSIDAVKGLTDKQIEDLVLLQTGMSYSYEEIDRGIAGKNAGDDAEIKITQDYITQTLASSIKAS